MAYTIYDAAKHSELARILVAASEAEQRASQEAAERLPPLTRVPFPETAPKPDHICTHCGDEDARNGICEGCWFGYDRARGLVNGCECERCETARESER